MSGAVFAFLQSFAARHLTILALCRLISLVWLRKTLELSLRLRKAVAAAAAAAAAAAQMESLCHRYPHHFCAGSRLQLGRLRRSRPYDILSHVTRHTSHVTRHTSHVTRHTSHVTRHTSHVTHLTRHTSHISHVTLPRMLRTNKAASLEHLARLYFCQ
jgi:hypothetical protein